MLVCVHGRCLFRPPNELVPEDLIIGLPGQLNDQGVFESHAVFDWSKAVSDYSYEVIESLPVQGATNASLGSTNDRAPDEQTVLAIFKRVPGSSTGQDEPLENYDTYTIKLRVFSDCAAGNYVTEASYTIDLTATYEFTHNFSQADAIFSPQGWQQPAQLVMHPDLEYESTHTIHFSQTHNITIRSSIHIIGGLNNKCAGVNADGSPCYGILNVSILRSVSNIENSILGEMSISYALSQFTVVAENPNRTLMDIIPNDFNVSRSCSIPYGDDYRFDICAATIDTSGNVSLYARDDNITQESTYTFHSINASCRYEVFFDECHYSPYAFVAGWFSYDFTHPLEAYHNHTLLGTTSHAFMT